MTPAREPAQNRKDAVFLSLSKGAAFSANRNAHRTRAPSARATVHNSVSAAQRREKILPFSGKQAYDVLHVDRNEAEGWEKQWFSRRGKRGFMLPTGVIISLFS